MNLRVSKRYLSLAEKPSQFTKAAEFYSKAVELNVKHESMAPVFSNRAQCQIKLESYGLAIQDAEKALEMNPKFYKAHHRRRQAYLSLGNYMEAIKSLAALKKVPVLTLFDLAIAPKTARSGYLGGNC